MKNSKLLGRTLNTASATVFTRFFAGFVVVPRQNGNILNAQVMQLMRNIKPCSAWPAPMTPATSCFPSGATNIWRNHSRPSREVDTLRTKHSFSKIIDSHTRAKFRQRPAPTSSTHPQRLKISSTMNGTDRKNHSVSVGAKSTSELSLHRLRRKPVQGYLTLLKTDLRHFLKCGILARGFLRRCAAAPMRNW